MRGRQQQARISTNKLLEAAGKGDKAGVESLLAQGADPNAKNKEGKSVLPLAASSGRDQMLRTLLRAGADINAKDKEDFTALMVAAREGLLDVIEELLAAKADVNARTNKSQTALIFAAGHGHVEVVKRLLAAGAELNIKTGSFENPKCQFYSTGQVNCHFVKVKGWTTLKAAKDGGYSDIVELLKKAGAKD